MEISKDSLIPLIRDFFSAIPSSGIVTLPDTRRISALVDNSYSALKKSDIIGTLKSNPLLAGAAESFNDSELFDCDDYALQLKASLTGLFRTRRLSIKTISPPAVGIVITQNHALNIVFCESSNASPELFLVDPSLKSPKLVSESSASSNLLKTLPVSLIYI